MKGIGRGCRRQGLRGRASSAHVARRGPRAEPPRLSPDHPLTNTRALFFLGSPAPVASKPELARKLVANRGGPGAFPGRGRTPHPCGGLGGHIVRDPRCLFSRLRALRSLTIAIPAG